MGIGDEKREKGKGGGRGLGLPKLAWKLGDVRPVAILFGSVAYSPYALNAGVSVAPSVNQNPPKLQKTTKLNVLPRKNSNTPPKLIRKPPMK